jgi:ABC-type spermidine/putrescine transport system permease subunit I
MTNLIHWARTPGAGWRRWAAAVPYGLLVPALAFVVFLFIGTGFLIRYSFDLWSPTTGMVSGWTLESYEKFFSQRYFTNALFKTVRLAFSVTVIALIMGYPVAYLMARSPRYRNLIMMMVVAPLVMDVVIRAYGWIVLLSNGGLVNTVILGLGLSKTPPKLLFTEPGVVAELLHETLAFMVLPIAAVLQKIDPHLGEASGTLGAGKWQKFWLITLPLSLPGVLAGTLLVFALGMSAFVGPLILGGGNVTVMSLLIRDQMGVTLDWPLGAAMSVLLVALTLILLFCYGRVLRAGAVDYHGRAGVRR